MNRLRAIAISLAVAVGGVFAAGAAGAAITNASVQPADLGKGATGTVRVQFDMPATIPARGSINVTFPAGFTFGSVAVSDRANISSPLAVSVSGQTVTLANSSGVSSGNGLGFTLSNVTNPSTAGPSGTFTIETKRSNGNSIDTGTAPAVTIQSLVAAMGFADRAAGASANVSVTMQTSVDIPASGKVRVTFPAGFNVAGAGVQASTTNLGGGTAVLAGVSGQVVTVDLGNSGVVTAGSGKVLTLTGVTNPGTPAPSGAFPIATLDSSSVVVEEGSAPSVAIQGTPGAPTGVTASAGDARATVAWTAPASTGGSPIIQYRVIASPGGQTCTTAGDLTCDVTLLSNGTAYTFTVEATNQDNLTSPASSPSAPVTPQAAPSPSPPPSPGTVPGAPRNVSVTAGDGSGQVSWQRPSGRGGNSVTGYTATASPGGASCTATGLSCTITGLTNGTSYTVTVVARNASGDGPASTPSAAFTPAGSSSATAGKKNSEDNRPRPKVTICHATASKTNPYVVITVDPNSVFKQGHDQHQDGRDIIPAFTYDENGQTIAYPGKNLTPEGLALLANGCAPSAATSVAAALIEAAKPAPKKTRVTLCHATASRTNPYVRITVAPEAVFFQGHDQHQDGRDIIPPFSYEDNGGTTRQYPGKNWDSESQAIFNNGCRPLGPETGPASLSADVTFCAALPGGQYVRTTATVAEVLQRNPGAGDIIPPFSYTSGGAQSFAGNNWTAANQITYNAGCVAPIPTTASAPVEPVVTCINLNDDGSFSAVFGYRNPNAVSVSAPVGAANQVSLDAGAQGATVGSQPTTFQPGSLDVALTVTGIGEDGSVTWTVAAPGDARSATASGASPRCTAPAPTPELSIRAECVIDQGNGTYAARFGYQSDETTNLQVALGPLNTLTQSSGGAIGQVQPATFQPGLNGSAFTVTGISSRRSVTWRVVTGATARTATASVDSLPSCFAPAPPPPGSEPTPGGPTSGGEVPPYQVPNPGPGGNVTCEQLGYSATSGRINYSDAGFTQAFARQGLTVSVRGGTYVTWSSGFPVGAVIVKGGPRANVYQYTPGRQGDSGLASPVNSSGNPAGLSNLTICWNPGAPAPDPQAPTTNPESTPTPPPPPGTPPGTPLAPSPLIDPVLPEPIGVSVACVKKNTNGTYDAVFAYSNPNLMSVSVPGGAANYVAESPGDPESQLRGQPTSFLPGTTPTAFTVTGVPGGKSITWTVAYYGTSQATADVNFPVSCGLVAFGAPLDPPVVKRNTPTPPVDPGDPASPLPTPPVVTPPTPATAQVGVFVACATVGRRTYSATFGYSNPNGTSLPIAVGPANRMVGARSYDRGQPGIFAPGTAGAAFTVTGIPRRARPSWQVTLPSGQVVSAVASPSAPRCAATSRAAGPGVTTVIDTPRRVPTRSRVLSRVRVSNPGTATLYGVEVTIPTPRNLSRPMAVRPPPGMRCTVRGSRTVCTVASLAPGVTRTVRISSRASTPGTRFPLSRAAGLSGSGSALTAVDSTPLTVLARGGQPVTG